MTGFFQNMAGFVLNITGFVLNMTEFVLNMTGIVTVCEGMANRNPSSRLFSELLSLSLEVRPPLPPFHIAHWTAQHPVGKDDILTYWGFLGKNLSEKKEEKNNYNEPYIFWLFNIPYS